MTLCLERRNGSGRLYSNQRYRVYDCEDGTVTTTLTMTKDADGNFIYLVQDKPETTPTATLPAGKKSDLTPKTTTVDSYT